MVNLEEFIGDKYEYCYKMRRSGEWADHIVVMLTAILLNRNIMIVMSSPGAGPDNIVALVGQDEQNRAPLLIGHRWESHYVSLCPNGKYPLVCKYS